MDTAINSAALMVHTPCLFIFSLSGHTKLLRYIAYIFPGIMLIMGTVFVRSHDNPTYIKRLHHITLWFWGFLYCSLFNKPFNFRLKHCQMQRSQLLSSFWFYHCLACFTGAFILTNNHLSNRPFGG